MKYTKKTANGDAGEFFFAYQIAKVLNWPCRLFDIDIGIDAQVEVMNKDETSTGKFVAFQIKATNDPESICRYVSMKQFDYWKELGLPVFVVLVNLLEEKMYLHKVDLYRKYRATKKNNICIDFNLAEELFSVDSGAVIISAVDNESLLSVRKYLKIVLEGTESIFATLARQENDPDPYELIVEMHGRMELRAAISQAKALSDELRVGYDECADAEEKLEESIGQLRDFMKDYEMSRDYDERDGAIERFFCE